MEKRRLSGRERPREYEKRSDDKWPFFLVVAEAEGGATGGSE